MVTVGNAGADKPGPDDSAPGPAPGVDPARASAWPSRCCRPRPCRASPTCAAPRPTGGCTASGCDPFYFHRVSAYRFGELWQNDGTARRFHSPNQVQVEFLCDVAEFPRAFVPMSVRTTAQADANQRAMARFTNGPGFRCGNPRPF